ncbi:MAG: hypothetical protein JNM74_05905, partial [Myxococcales bacterium]|nr:hypothetical protein [Myxococcales bacterium]
ALVGQRAGIRIAPADDATLDDVLRVFASVDRLGLGTGVPVLVADSGEAERACRGAR